MKNRVLFICTGNYYRSRYAEAVFNHLAEEHGLGWKAFSRGLAIDVVPPGFHLSIQTEQHLTARNIDLRHTAPIKTQLSEADLGRAEIVIALKDEEHRPMVRTMFPEWEEKMIFWDVGDQPEVRPNDGLGQIHEQVLELVEALRGDEQMALQA